MMQEKKENESSRSVWRKRNIKEQTRKNEREKEAKRKRKEEKEWKRVKERMTGKESGGKEKKEKIRKE